VALDTARALRRSGANGCPLPGIDGLEAADGMLAASKTPLQ